MAYIPPNPNGQATKANSSPVVLASDQNNALETGGNLATIATNTPAKGTALPSASQPSVLPVQAITGSAQSAPALNYEFLTATSSGWFDALGYNSISFTVVTGTGISAGVLAFEQTNDTTAAAAGVAFTVQDASTGNVTRVTGLTLAASTTKQYEAPISARYVRVRVSTAVVGGTVTVSAALKQSPSAVPTQNVAVTSAIPAGANNIGIVSLAAGTNNVGLVSLATSTTTDIASAAITTTATSAAVAQTNLLSASFNVAVTVVSGTSPTMDIVIQETIDGTNYNDLYHFERITATGSYSTPVLRINGQSIRYVRTIAGTTPSFTMSLVRLGKVMSVSDYRTFHDRALAASQALNAVTASYYVQGTTQVQMLISSGAATTACVIQLQGSVDKSNWYAIGSTLTSVASSTVATAINTHGAKYIRGIVTTAGVTQTLNYVTFIAQASS